MGKRVVTPKVVVKEPVAEVAKISSVKQDTFTEFTVTMSKALETAAAADFGMVRDDDNQVITVRSAALDATDKTKVKLTVYTSLTDAKTYTVTYTASDAAKTQSTAKVTVTDGTVADVALTPLEITANKETEMRYQTLDANGVIVSEGLASKASNNVDVTWDSLLGTMDNATSKYILYNVGDTAKFNVTYHTYKYDTTTGAEVGVITKDFTVTAVKDAAVISQYTYTAALNGNKPFDWSKVTPKQTIALSDEGAQQRTAYFLIKDSKGNNVTTDCGYTVESSDNSIVVADGDVKDGALLSPVAKGSAYLMIKDTDGKVVHTLPITVGDKRTISTFKLSASVINVVSGATIASPATCGYTDVVAKDQYGEDINVTLDIKNKTVENDTTPIVTEKTGYLAIEGRNKKSSENYIITATDALNKSMPTSLRVNTIDPTGGVTYSVVFLQGTSAADYKVVTSIDTTLSETDGSKHVSQALKAYIVKKQNNIVVDVLRAGDVTGMTVTKNDGTQVAKVTTGDSVAKIVSSDAIPLSVVQVVTGSVAEADLDVVNDGVDVKVSDHTSHNTVKNLGAGTYTVVFTLAGADGKAVTSTDRASANFVVKDTQTTVTARVKETNCGDKGGDIKALLKSGDYIDYYYGDVKVDVAAIDSAKVTISNGAKNAFVSNVTFKVQVADVTVGTDVKTMTVTVPVNKTFITTGNQWINP